MCNKLRVQRDKDLPNVAMAAASRKQASALQRKRKLKDLAMHSVTRHAAAAWSEHFTPSFLLSHSSTYGKW